MEKALVLCRRDTAEKTPQPGFFRSSTSPRGSSNCIKEARNRSRPHIIPNEFGFWQSWTGRHYRQAPRKPVRLRLNNAE